LGKAQGFASDIQKRGGLGGCKPSQGFAFDFCAIFNGIDYTTSFTLETAVVSTHLTQPIDSPSIMVKTLITNKVTAIFTITLGKPIAYAMHALPTAVSRFTKQIPFLKH
jgi:hypothetical protein